MIKPQDEPSGELEVETTEERTAPRHGDQGDRQRLPSKPLLPLSLTIAISRETGARGGSIGKRVGRKLGWQVYNQEMMENMAQHGLLEHDLTSDLPAAAARWAAERWQAVVRDFNLNAQPTLVALAQIILNLGAQGEVILVGRGAGCILPAESTLNVRIIAPLEDRIAYMSQWLRLTPEEAAQQVEVRDRRRNAFVATYFRGHPNEPHPFDITLNSKLLGEEACAEIIAMAARAKLTSRQQADEMDD